MEREVNIKRPVAFAAVVIVLSAWCAITADNFLFAIGLAVLTLVLIAVSKRTGIKWSVYLYILIYIISYFYFTEQVKPISIDSYIKENEPEATVCGTVKSITKKDNYYSVVLENCTVYCNEAVEKINGLLIYTSKIDFTESDRVRVDGTIKGFEMVRNEGGFDSGKYYESIGISYKMSAKSIEVYASDKKTLYSYLSCIREKIAGIYSQIAPEKQAGIFTSIVLGDKSGLDNDVKKLYQRNGISHLLAISGLHISLIGMSLYKLLRRSGVSFAMSFAFGSLMVMFYGILTGNGISAMRAVIMCLLVMLAELLGRTYDMMSALGTAAILIIADNPKVLYNSGFLLSFGAILGIAVIYPVLEKLFIKDKLLPPVKYLLSALLVSISVSLTTFPIILCSYYEFPLYSVFLNLIVIPLMTILMFSAAAAGLAGFISVTAGRFLIGLAYYILDFYEKLCSFTQELPYSTIITGKPARMAVIIYVILLIVFAALSKWERLKELKRLVVLPLLAVCILCAFSGRKSGFEIDVIDVGQGDGVLLMTPEGESYLFDGGSSDESKLADNILLPLFKSKGIKQIDYAVISHSDEDHISGVLEMLSQGSFRIDTLVLPEIKGFEEDENYCRLLAAAKENGVNVQYAKAGTVLGTERVSIKCLHPEENYAYTSANDYSAVYQITYGEFDMLMTGDIEQRAEAQLLKADRLKDIEVLKVAHHGSKTSTGEAFLQAVKPEAAVISCGVDNSYGHPHSETLERLKEAGSTVISTAESGQVTLKICKDKIKIVQYIKKWN